MLRLMRLMLAITGIAIGNTVGVAQTPKGEPPSDQALTKRATLTAIYASTIAFSPDGKLLATGHAAGLGVRLWDATTGKEGPKMPVPFDVVHVDVVAFSPDSKILAWVENRTVRLVDVETKKERASFRGPSLIASLVWSPDGKLIAGAGLDEQDGDVIKLWDVTEGQERAALKGHTERVKSITFMPDGKTLASGGHDKTVKLWDLPSAKERATLRGHTSLISWVCSSPDGKIIASADLAGAIKFWDPSGKPIAAFRDRLSITALAFGADSRALAAGMVDGTIKIWQTATGNAQVTLKADGEAVKMVAFSPDGKTLATLGDKVHLWDAPAAVPSR